MNDFLGDKSQCTHLIPSQTFANYVIFALDDGNIFSRKDKTEKGLFLSYD